MQNYIKRTIEISRTALQKNEVPITCILKLGDSEIITHNLTNEYKNPLAHAELIAIGMVANLKNGTMTCINKTADIKKHIDSDDNINTNSKIIDTSINNHPNNIHIEYLKLAKCYVNVEPCGMCMHFLKENGIEVFYACRNKIFGGNSVFNINYGTFVDGYENEIINMLKEFYCMENENAPAEIRKSKEKRKKQ